MHWSHCMLTAEYNWNDPVTTVPSRLHVAMYIGAWCGFNISFKNALFWQWCFVCLFYLFGLWHCQSFSEITWDWLLDCIVRCYRAPDKRWFLANVCLGGSGNNFIETWSMLHCVVSVIMILCQCMQRPLCALVNLKTWNILLLLLLLMTSFVARVTWPADVARAK